MTALGYRSFSGVLILILALAGTPVGSATVEYVTFGSGYPVDGATIRGNLDLGGLIVTSYPPCFSTQLDYVRLSMDGGPAMAANFDPDDYCNAYRWWRGINTYEISNGWHSFVVTVRDTTGTVRSAQATFYVDNLGTPDLVASISTRWNAHLVADIEANVQICNIGNAGAEGSSTPFSLRDSLRTYHLADFVTPPLAPGACVSHQLRIDCELAVGEFRLLSRADGLARVIESNELNNGAEKVVWCNVPGYPPYIGVQTHLLLRQL